MINIIQIKDLDAPELQIYYNLNEAQLFHYFEPKPGIFIAESPKVIERALDAGCVPLSFLMEKKTRGDTGKRNPCALRKVTKPRSYTEVFGL